MECVHRKHLRHLLSQSSKQLTTAFSYVCTISEQFTDSLLLVEGAEQGKHYLGALEPRLLPTCGSCSAAWPVA